MSNEKRLFPKDNRKKARNTVGNLSVEQNCYANASEVSEILSNSLYWYGRPLVKTDEECEARLHEFFERCTLTGEIPTVEKMCLALGTVRQTVFEWEHNKNQGQRRADLIRQAKEMISAFDGELVMRNKVNPTTYIFRSKNFSGMRDQQEVILEPKNPLGEGLTEAELIEKYKKNLPSGNE